MRSKAQAMAWGNNSVNEQNETEDRHHQEVAGIHLSATSWTKFMGDLAFRHIKSGMLSKWQDSTSECLESWGRKAKTKALVPCLATHCLLWFIQRMMLPGPIYDAKSSVSPDEQDSRLAQLSYSSDSKGTTASGSWLGQYELSFPDLTLSPTQFLPLKMSKQCLKKLKYIHNLLLIYSQTHTIFLCFEAHQAFIRHWVSAKQCVCPPSATVNANMRKHKAFRDKGGTALMHHIHHRPPALHETTVSSGK